MSKRNLPPAPPDLFSADDAGATANGDSEESRQGAPPRSAALLKSLDVFVAVTKTRGFSAAGRALGMSQPAITQRMQALEEGLGVQLFRRAQTGSELTSAGLTMLSYAERLIALRDEMLEALSGEAFVQTGYLRVAASTTPGNYLLPPMMMRFREKFPGIQLVLDIADSGSVAEAIKDGRSELGVVGLGLASAEFTCEPLVEDEIVVIAAPSHPLMRHERPTLRQLCEHPWVMREGGSDTRRSVEALLIRSGLGGRMQVALEVNNTEALKLAVRAELGIATVSRRAVENELALGLLQSRPLGEGGIRRQFCLVRHARRTLSPPGAAFWQHLVGPRRVTAD